MTEYWHVLPMLPYGIIWEKSKEKNQDLLTHHPESHYRGTEGLWTEYRYVLYKTESHWQSNLYINHLRQQSAWIFPSNHIKWGEFQSFHKLERQRRHFSSLPKLQSHTPSQSHAKTLLQSSSKEHFSVLAGGIFGSNGARPPAGKWNPQSHKQLSVKSWSSH